MTGDVVRMGAAPAIAEAPDLFVKIPARERGDAGSAELLIAFAIVAVAGGADAEKGIVFGGGGCGSLLVGRRAAREGERD